MNLYKLTQEEIEILKTKKQQKQSEYDILISKTSEALWTEDIEHFKNSWDKSLKSYIKEHSSVKKKQLKVKKKRRSKSKKSKD